MTIDATQRKAIAAGQTLTAKYKGTQYSVEIITGEGGKLLYRLGDGREFKSPSSAGSAVMGGSACNGWRFWSVDDGTKAPPAKPAKAAAKTPAKPGKKATAKTPAPKQPAAAGRPRCKRCGKSFVSAQQLAHHEANADRLCRPAA